MARLFMELVFPLAALLLIQPACGGKALENSGNGPGGSSSGGSSNDGGSKSASAGESAGGSSHGGQANGGSGGSAPQCDGFENEPGGNVAVRLINGTKMLIYLGPETRCSGTGALFQVSDSNSQPLSRPQSCTPTCQDIIDGNHGSCPATPCVPGSTVTLQPGESVIQRWTADFAVADSLPPECSRGGNNDCQRVEAVKPGTFTFAARAGTNIDCSSYGSMGCGPCVLDSNGGCVTYGGLVTGPFLSSATTVMLDASYGIGGPGGGMARDVEIIF